MPILVNRDTKVVVQGITGREGSFQTRRCIEYGTKVVAGVTPGRGGEEIDGVPVFDTVRQAVARTGADCSLIFVPAPAAADAILEAAYAEVPVIVCITEGIPVVDMVRVKRYLRGSGIRLIGPNCPGVITPGQCRVGIMPGDVFSPGPVGVISRSGTLVYEAVSQLTARGIGQSTCVGVGGDPVIGTAPVEVLRLFNEDPETKAVVLIGEIGGTAEQEAAAYIASEMRKPVIAFIAGASAPPGRRMGHAGAIIVGEAATAQAKKKALAAAGATIVDSPAEIGAATEAVLRERGLL
ncbi:MAG: succinate--CoA ligase subunit alpha [Dehalococcoidia bacterium]|jgi:succinyl-CoA synthetase alpha subunit|nr:succinate--CoA ligase subunit alpha [Dehalococcoidia bacterium]MDW8008540.1 succinate--CoA ligase subunit alpha [Chloroflexota bacterium]